MSLLSEIEIRKIKDETVREVIRRLVKNAKDPARIGRRVLALDFHLREGERREKLLTFAKSLKVSCAAASQSVAEAQASLIEVRSLTPLDHARAP